MRDGGCLVHMAADGFDNLSAVADFDRVVCGHEGQFVDELIRLPAAELGVSLPVVPYEAGSFLFDVRAGRTPQGCRR